MDDIDWIGMAEKAGYAIVILIVTWVLATIVKWAIGKLVMRIPALQAEGADGQSTGQSIGTIGSLLIWLFGLVAVLKVFELEPVLSPIQGLLNRVMDYLPNVVAAAVVFFIGFVIAKIVKQLIETTVGMMNIGSLTAKAKGAAATAGGESAGQHTDGDTGEAGIDSQRIGSMVGNLAFAVILIVVGIASLQILAISVISDPAQEMLTLILNAIPWIIAAAIILGIGVLISKLVGSVLDTTLRGLGTDRAMTNMGVTRPNQSATAIITRIAQVAVMVFFGIMAARALNFPEITNILNEVLALGGHVLFGGVIIAAGFLVAKLVSGAIGEGTMSSVISYATIALFAAMGLKYMGIADSIITLAFGAVVVGGALAAALAFGLGGRDAAARTLAEAESKRDRSH